MKHFAWFFGLFAALVLLEVETVKGLKVGLYLLLLMVLLLFLQSSRFTAQQAMLGFSVVSVLVLFWIASEWYMQEGERWQRVGEFFGDEINPVHFSLLITCALSFLWLFYLDDYFSRYSKAVWLVAFLLFGVLVLLCASVFQARSVLLGFAAFLVGYVIYRRAFAVGFVLLLVLLLVTFGLGLNEALAERGASYRLGIWQDAWQRLTQQCNLWLGCSADDGYLFMERFRHAHSAYVSMFYKNGLIGGVLFLLLGAVLFWQVLRYRARWGVLALLGWGAVFTTTGGVFVSPHPLWVYFWLPTLMALIEMQRAAQASASKLLCASV